MARRFFEDPDDGDADERLPENVEKAPLPLRIIGKTVKYLFWAVIALIIGLWFWRMFSNGAPSDMKTVYADKELQTAYSEYLADTSEDKGYFAIYDEYCFNRPLTVDEEDEETGQKNNYGYFGITDQIIFPTANQAQIIFRYNRSTLAHLQEDYDLPETPDRDEDYYDVTARVLVYNDVNDKEAGTHVERLEFKTVASDKKNLYCFRQMTISGLPDLEEIKEIYIDIYYNCDINYDDLPYGAVRIYSDEFEPTEYELDKNDIKALKGEE